MAKEPAKGFEETCVASIVFRDGSTLTGLSVPPAPFGLPGWFAVWQGETLTYFNANDLRQIDMHAPNE